MKEDDPASKSAMDYLVDIGADIAEYMTQIKTYDSSKANQELEYVQLRTQISTSLEELILVTSLQVEKGLISAKRTGDSI